jgi:CopG family transcriptional regulator, nickel-responsive regulator
MSLKRSGESVTRVSLSLPPKLLEEFDDASDRAGFRDRSKSVQASMRNFITEEEQKLERSGFITGALLMIYDHETPDIDAKLTSLEHRNRKMIASSTHMHLGVSHCLKVLVVRGQAAEITNFEKKLRSLNGIMQLKLSYMKTEAS